MAKHGWWITLALLVAGCSAQPVRGVIAKKNHRGGWVQFIQVDKTTIPIMHPDQWDIVVQNDGTTGEKGRFLVVVSQRYWDQVNIGDVWERADTIRESAHGH